MTSWSIFHHRMSPSSKTLVISAGTTWILASHNFNMTHFEIYKCTTQSVVALQKCYFFYHGFTNGSTGICWCHLRHRPPLSLSLSLTMAQEGMRGVCCDMFKGLRWEQEWLILAIITTTPHYHMTRFSKPIEKHDQPTVFRMLLFSHKCRPLVVVTYRAMRWWINPN